jgi:hypothetical protein
MFDRNGILFRLPLSHVVGGEAETGKGPVDLFSAERAHMLLVRPGGNKGRGVQHINIPLIPIPSPARGEGSEPSALRAT